MEANLCDDHHLDSDVLLPPRKRLLAGLKRHNFDGYPFLPSNSLTLSEFDMRLHNLLRSHLNDPNFSPEDIVESSRSAAAAAVEVAKSSRAVAEEKAVTAAKAIAAAKSALELVAFVSEGAANRESCLKNKMKKHLPVQILYNKDQYVENCRTDEELARKLHRAMNSSPRICKSPSTSELRKKRLKGLCSTEKTKILNGGTAWGGPSTMNGNATMSEVDLEASVHEACVIRVDKSTLKLNKADWLKLDNGVAEASNAKGKTSESSDDTCSIGRKRGRIKQKKLPLSICTSKDQANAKEELRYESLSLTEEKTRKLTSNNKPLYSLEPSPDVEVLVQTTNLWKCQAFKAHPYVKQNKVMQS